ncbi:hypothetical protein Hanom_Chr02g00120741 [Helianthus anomalus]
MVFNITLVFLFIYRLTRYLEVRYENIRMVAECEVVHGKPLPTIWNYTFGYCRNFGDEQPSNIFILLF